MNIEDFTKKQIPSRRALSELFRIHDTEEAVNATLSIRPGISIDRIVIETINGTREIEIKRGSGGEE